MNRKNRNAMDEYSLERYLLGELAEENYHDIRQRLEIDVGLQQHLQEIETSNREILAQYPAGLVVPLILQRQQENREKRSKRSGRFPVLLKRILLASPALGAALLLLVLTFPPSRQGTRVDLEEEQPEIVNIKGEAEQPVNLFATQLLVHRKGKNHVELLRNGSSAKAGDLLQLGYIAATESYGIILSIDGQGRVTLHFPESKAHPADLVPHRKILLPNAIELDNAPAFERFFFITSGSPLKVAGILRAAEKLAEDIQRARTEPLPLPGDLHQYSLIILKGAVPSRPLKTKF